MKLTTLILLSSLLTSGFAVPLGPGNLLQPRQSIQTTTDTLLFVRTMPQFQAARNARNPPNLDWSSDNCSSSPDNPFGFNFVQSCQRHDFGYRNYKAQRRFTDAAKARIDSKFRADMYNQCERESLREACRATADVYYFAVVNFANKKREAEESSF